MTVSDVQSPLGGDLHDVEQGLDEVTDIADTGQEADAAPTAALQRFPQRTRSGGHAGRHGP
jgi:hypothetical protein